MAKFLIDAQLPPKLAKALDKIGHDATHVYEIGLNDAKDKEIAKYAEKLNAILITKDEDFITLSNMGQFSAPVIWMRIGNTTNHNLWSKLEPILSDILTAIENGEKIIEII